MEMSFRWFGRDNDPIPLEYIRQIPGTGEVVWALHHKKPGEIWTKDEIETEVSFIKSLGLKTSVVESVNIHDDIKLGLESREEHIANYITTLENLAAAGVKVVCYNFMPVFDWTRTELFRPLADGSTAMYMDKAQIIDTDPQQLISMFEKGSKGLTLPGWEPERMAKIKELFVAYEGITGDELRANFKYFIDAIIPTCEKHDIKMAIHPDDPPFEIFNLPRLVNNQENIDLLLEVNNSPYHGLTFCTGSLGANPENNQVEMLKKYVDRTHFMHIRNVDLDEEGNFTEVSHRTADGTVDVVNLVKVLIDNDFKGYIRPDHGRNVFGEDADSVRPGYGLYDRAMGIMYLNGCIDAFTTK